MDYTQKRILVVDDEEDIRMMLCRAVLRSLKSQVDTASNGIEALEKIRARHYDVLVTDLAMPEMDGATLFRTVKEHHPQMQVIVLTAAPSLESSMAAVKSHVFSYLPKPILMDRFVREVETALQEQERQRNLQSAVDTGDALVVMDTVERSAQDIATRIEALAGLAPVSEVLDLKNHLVRHREHLRYLRMLLARG